MGCLGQAAWPEHGASRKSLPLKGFVVLSPGNKLRHKVSELLVLLLFSYTCSAIRFPLSPEAHNWGHGGQADGCPPVTSAPEEQSWRWSWLWVLSLDWGR